MAESLESMPFITGPVGTPETQLRPSPPQGNLTALVPLSKVQEVLWLDYIRRPWTTHYTLTLQVDLTGTPTTLENILNSKLAVIPFYTIHTIFFFGKRWILTYPL